MSASDASCAIGSVMATRRLAASGIRRPKDLLRLSQKPPKQTMPGWTAAPPARMLAWRQPLPVAETDCDCRNSTIGKGAGIGPLHPPAAVPYPQRGCHTRAPGGDSCSCCAHARRGDRSIGPFARRLLHQAECTCRGRRQATCLRAPAWSAAREPCLRAADGTASYQAA